MAKHPIIFCLALFLIAGIVFSWPLAPNFFSSIPYTLRPIPGYERVPLMPGDHLQTYYWFWLLSDNLFGQSHLFTNPYEFNGPLGPMSSVYADFPFSVLYILFLPLGQIGAYNGLIFLSFMLCGLAMFLLARSWTNDFWAALVAGVIFTVTPFRVSHIAGGQLPGYDILFLPLCLYYIDRALTSGRWVYGGAVGLFYILLSRMDPHTSYLAALTIGLYLPSQLLFNRPFPLNQEGKNPSLWAGLIGALIGGLSFALFLWIRFGTRDSLFQPVLLGMGSILVLWFYFSVVLSRLTTLSFPEARRRVGRGFYFFLPLWVYPLKYEVTIPHLGLILIVISTTSFVAFLIFQWWRQRDRLLSLAWGRILPVLVGTGLGLAISTAYLIRVRTTVFLPSLAGKGRTLSEVFLFSPRIGNLFFWQDLNQERFILLGWGLVILAGFGFLHLLKSRPKEPGLLALAGLLAFLGVILALGPKLTTFPLYRILYQYFPFFSYSRVPYRFLFIGLIFLCLLAAMGLSFVREQLVSRGWIRISKWFPVMVILIIGAEFHSWQPLGLSVMPKGNKTYQLIEKRLSEGKRVLELPIWPGDSHQSSVYEYNVTRTRKPMINGYAPVVFRDYIQQVFWPLFPLDFGELNLNQAQTLKKLKVDLITFHDNSLIYPEKISPFPPRLALERLMASPWLQLIALDQDTALFKFNSNFAEVPLNQNKPPNPSRGKGELGGFKGETNITSPVSAVFYAHNLWQDTGRYERDPSASGYYLLMDEKELDQGRFIPRPEVRGNVASADPSKDQPGLLVSGPNQFFPAGKFKARFRIKAGVVDPQQELGRIEIIGDRRILIKKKIIYGQDMDRVYSWTDIPLEFEIPKSGEIGFRFHYSGGVRLKFNLAVIGFADQNTGPGTVEADELLRQTGTVVTDPLASGNKAVWGKAGFHPPIYLCYGPYRTFEAGRYEAAFSLRMKEVKSTGQETPLALLEVATDMGKRVLGRRLVRLRDLRSDAYREVGVIFKIPFKCEVGYRVKFLGKADIWIDRIKVVGIGEAEGKG